MTDKEAFQEWCKEILPIVQGAANGEDVEIDHAGNPADWKPKTTRYFSHVGTYRLKPKPQYRPYRPQEAAVCLLGKTIKHTWDNAHSQVFGIHIAGVTTGPSVFPIPYQSLAASYVFKGTGLPCGVLIQESSNG